MKGKDLHQGECENMGGGKKDQAAGGATDETVSRAGDDAGQLTVTLQRVQAEFENYKKRMEKHMEEFSKNAARDVILKILPVVDNFELALKDCPKDEFGKGIELIYSQLFTVLQDAGVAKIQVKDRFDPFIHEALLKVDSEEPENTILEVLQMGYTLNGKVLRHTKVKVSNGNSQKSGEGKGN